MLTDLSFKYLDSMLGDSYTALLDTGYYYDRCEPGFLLAGVRYDGLSELASLLGTCVNDNAS